MMNRLVRFVIIGALVSSCYGSCNQISGNSPRQEAVLRAVLADMQERGCDSVVVQAMGSGPYWPMVVDYMDVYLPKLSWGDGPCVQSCLQEEDIADNIMALLQGGEYLEDRGGELKSERYYPVGYEGPFMVDNLYPSVAASLESLELLGKKGDSVSRFRNLSFAYLALKRCYLWLNYQYLSLLWKMQPRDRLNKQFAEVFEQHGTVDSAAKYWQVAEEAQENLLSAELKATEYDSLAAEADSLYEQWDSIWQVARDKEQKQEIEDKLDAVLK